MGFDDIVNKGKELFEENKDKVGDFLKSDQAEDISDKVIDGASGVAKKVVPDEHHGTVDDIAAKVDGAVGSE
ncbi:MAG TPA: hypothetical protein VFN24_00915 [Microbacterium sp.]|jgi:hypothetical protein|nr:hypothetical protein [Microbacterium sp.]